MKQIFPYSYISWSNLDTPASTLPPRSQFYNDLHQEEVSEEDYRLACYFYQLFNCNCIADYMKIYTLLDVTLLADVWLNHRANCLDFFKVEPLNFLSLPAMSFRLVLGHYGHGLEYISDPDIYLLAKKAIRGGVVNYSDRLAYANYPDRNSFDPSKPPSSLIQLDFCAMYSFCMNRKLAVGSYRFLSPEEVSCFDPFAYDDDGAKGFLVSCDLKIEASWHDYYADLPPMPERVKIDASCASEFQREFQDEMGNSFMNAFKTEQLITSLYDKEGYVLHNFLLKTYLRMGGITVSKIHQVVQYSQTAFMKDFINMGIERRNSTNDESLKSYYKGICNSAYGFTSLKIEDFCNVHIIKSSSEAVKIINRPSFKGFSIIAPSLAVLESSPVSVLIRNHLLVASGILDASKQLLYGTWYQSIKQHFMQNNIACKLYYCDTDSMLLSISLPYEESLLELDKIRYEGRPIMDWSYLPSDHNLYSTVYENHVGFLKSETKYNRILALATLKKKFYALQVENAANKLRGKGVPKKILKRDFDFNSYVNTLIEGNIHRVSMKLFKRMHQQVVQISQLKMAFNSFSASRYLCPPRGLETLPWGHYTLQDGEVEVVTND